MNDSKTGRVPLGEKKALLLEQLHLVRLDILEAARTFRPQDVEQRFVGWWTVLDLLAHLRGWDMTNRQAAEEILAGKLPSFYAEYDKDWASYNAKLVAQYQEVNLADMIAATEASHELLLQYLEGLSPEEVMTDQGVRHGQYKVIISRLLEAEKKDERRHLQQIRGFLQEQLQA